ncbi:MAG: hypothetical protein LQ346_004031 [Caloplaca aetnensis]|nr:MAG: hypothetical protein LQ346_004031 [Caloplaca aetnensis]
MQLEPWQSWAIVAVGATGAYLYYSRTGNKRRGRGRTPFIPNLVKRRNSPRRGSSADAGPAGSAAPSKIRSKKGESRVDAGTAQVASSSIPPSSNGKIKKRKGGKQEIVQVAQSSSVDGPPTIAADDGTDEVDNRQFAKQMTGLKTGSSMAKKDLPRGQTKKQGKQAELPLNSFNALATNTNGGASDSNMKEFSNASSTTGADADDDLSPLASPPFGAQQQTATSGDINDMLEAPSKGPSVLRLTDVEEPKRQSRPQKVAQEAETKKQRQNRRKNEEKKLARDQAEKERRVLLERQLRIAREAEGRPARDGVSAPSASNAWSKASTSVTTPQQVSSSMPNTQLLDTFDESPNSGPHAAQDMPMSNMKARHDEAPLEEEQMRILSEMDGSGGWNTVSKGGKKKKSAMNGKEHERKMSTTSASLAGTDEHSTSTSDDVIPRATPSQSQTEDETPKPSKLRKEDVDPKIWNRENIHEHPAYDPAYPYALTGHPEDSDWAVV